MKYIRAFVMFWVDFIIGDAWEVAAGVAAGLLVIGIAAHRWDGNALFGFLLFGIIAGITCLALMRTTAAARR